MDSTRALNVCYDIWHQDVSTRTFKSCICLHGSNLFEIKMRIIWRLNQCCKLFSMFLVTFLNISFDIREYGFYERVYLVPSRTLPKASQWLCQLAFFPRCILVPPLHQVRDAQAHGRPHDVKDKTGFIRSGHLFSIARCSSSDAHVTIVGAFSGGYRSTRALWPIWSYVAPSSTKCNAQWTSVRDIEISNLNSVGSAFTSYLYQSALRF